MNTPMYDRLAAEYYYEEGFSYAYLGDGAYLPDNLDWQAGFRDGERSANDYAIEQSSGYTNEWMF